MSRKHNLSLSADEAVVLEDFLSLELTGRAQQRITMTAREKRMLRQAWARLAKTLKMPNRIKWHG